MVDQQALESKCHTGKTILYDTVTVKGWSVDVRTHRIGEIINKVLADPWPVDKEVVDPSPSSQEVFSLCSDQDQKQVEPRFWNWWGWGRRGPGKGKGGEDDDDDGGWDKHGGVPEAESEDDCIDCYKWSVPVPLSEEDAHD